MSKFLVLEHPKKSLQSSELVIAGDRSCSIYPGAPAVWSEVSPLNFFLLWIIQSALSSQVPWGKGVPGDSSPSSAAVQWLCYAAVICL